MKNNFVIGLSGHLKSGKDEVGKIIQYLMSHEYKVHKMTYTDYINGVYEESLDNVKFADKLKDMVCLLIGCTRKKLEDQDFKDKELGEKWRVWKYWASWDYEHETKIYATQDEAEEHHQFSTDNHRGSVKGALHNHGIETYVLTPRKLMQLLGTEAGRMIIHPNIWINSTFADYTKDSKWLITDVRFHNEVEVVEREGILIRINRPIKFAHKELWDKFSANIQTYREGMKNWGIQDDEIIFANWLKDYDCETYEKLYHESEIALDNYPFKYVIENNGTIEDLIPKTAQILIKNKLLEL